MPAPQHLAPAIPHPAAAARVAARACAHTPRGRRAAAQLGPPSTALSVFQQSDGFLNEMVKQGMRVASFGCDGGVHGMEVVESLQRTTGQKLSFIQTRTVEPLEGLLLDSFRVKLVISKADYGVVVGILDPPHVAKRQVEQHASGVHFLQVAPRVYSSWGVVRVAGAPADVRRLINRPRRRQLRACITLDSTLDSTLDPISP
eukprot:225037-Prymnesium_polylepis.2